MERVRLRTARVSDAAALLAIYAPYVRETAITFEYDVPDEREFAARIRHVLEKFPYLVAEADGEIVGYAYAGAFHPRAAYQWCAASTSSGTRGAWASAKRSTRRWRRFCVCSA